MIKYPKSELYFLLLLLLIVFVIVFFIFKPFIYTLILAAVFAMVFDSVHSKISTLTKGKGNLSATLATIFVLLVVILPIGYVGSQILKETSQLYVSLVTNGGVSSLIEKINSNYSHLSDSYKIPVELSSDISQYLRQGLNLLISNLGSLFTNVTKIFISIFIFLLALFYLFKDGDKLKESFIALSPLQDSHDQKILDRIASSINSVIKGSLFTSILQGLFTGIGFYIFNIPNPTLWGVVAIIAALIPSFGTALVFIPAIIYSYFASGLMFAIGLLVWGVFAVGLIDNILGPKFVGRGIQIHPFLILLSIIGGLTFFGPIGFLLGPIILSLSFELLDIYNLISQKYTG